MSPGIDSASLCSLAARYDNAIPTRFLAPIDCYKITALYSTVLYITVYRKERTKDKPEFQSLNLARA
jgi:hypothetical protein